MWGIETYKETGEFFMVGSEKWPKHETLFEPISEDLETALDIFAKKYPSDLFHLRVAWRLADNVRFFLVEEQVREYEDGRIVRGHGNIKFNDGHVVREYMNMAATLTKEKNDNPV